MYYQINQCYHCWFITFTLIFNHTIRHFYSNCTKPQYISHNIILSKICNNSPSKHTNSTLHWDNYYPFSTHYQERGQFLSFGSHVQYVHFHYFARVRILQRKIAKSRKLSFLNKKVLFKVLLVPLVVILFHFVLAIVAIIIIEQ